jgi:hypothetical protein
VAAENGKLSSGLGSFEVVHDPSRAEYSVPGALHQTSKSAATVDPGYTATDLNANNGPQTVTEGTDAIVTLATIGADGPTGTFTDRHGVVAC